MWALQGWELLLPRHFPWFHKLTKIILSHFYMFLLAYVGSSGVGIIITQTLPLVL